MKLEQQVVSLEIAKRLKELGAKQESLYHWVDSGNIQEYWSLISNYSGNDGLSAFTVAELGEMLPTSLYKENQTYFFNLANGNGVRCPNYVTYINGQTGIHLLNKLIWEKTEAEARGKMLIYLLENKLITL